MRESPSSSARQIATDVGWGVRAGAVYGVLLSVLAIVIASLRLERRQIAAEAPELAQALLIYFGGGIVAGAIVGLLRPLTRRRDGATLVAILALLPAMFCLGLAMFGTPVAWTRAEWLGLAISAVVFGVLGARSFYRPLASEAPVAELHPRLRTVMPPERHPPEV